VHSEHPALLTQWNALVADNVAQAANATSRSLVRGVFAGLRSACGVRWAWPATAGLCHAFLHRVSKNAPLLACYNFDTHEWILIFFGRNITNKVSNQKTLYYATSNKTVVTCAIYCMQLLHAIYCMQ